MIRYCTDGDESGVRAHAVEGHNIVATATWTRMPGPRAIYWSHGLNIPEGYRRQGVGTSLRQLLESCVEDGALVMLSVARGNEPQRRHITKNGYSAVMDCGDFTIYAKQIRVLKCQS